ncbi:MAG: hypothetical protein JST44_15015 [Cyanobacteria bacterium SZAS LIN-5]|nr:hypothetical protein [Cyanobacteria bacterium SZAS LIN-5]
MESTMQTVDHLPLWAFFLVVLVIAFLSTEVGHRIGAWRLRTRGTEPQASLGTIVASVLGLLAFMLGFTFNVALSRFDERRAAILDDANSIGTTYLRADFLEEPQRSQVKRLLRQYVQVRINGIVPEELNEIAAKSQGLQHQLWSVAAAFGKEKPNPITGLFISSLNETIDMDSKRINIGIYARVPDSVWLVLFAVSMLSMLGVGYYSGQTGSRSWAEILLLVLTFALVTLLVADLDRPHEGFIKASQQPMESLQKQIGLP